MVNATTEDSNPVINISAVFSNTYTSNETMVTLTFTVKRDYTDMSTYLTPSVREVTDSNMSNVSINWVYDPNAGLTDSSQNLVPDEDQSTGSGSTSGSTGGTTSGTTGSDTSGGTSSGSGNTASSGSGGSGLGTTTTSNGSVKKNVDNTPSTGAVDLTLVLGIVIAVFVGISGICLFVLNKKKRVA
jgi:hypothetical protein